MGRRGTKPKKGLHAKKKQYKRGHDTKRRRRDIDQIQDDLKKAEETGQPMTFENDEDLTGMGLFYCAPCARHFVNEHTLNEHKKGKLHKRRLKDVAQKQYNQDEADGAAGMTKEILPPAHASRSSQQAMAES